MCSISAKQCLKTTWPLCSYIILNVSNNVQTLKNLWCYSLNDSNSHDWKLLMSFVLAEWLRVAEMTHLVIKIATCHIQMVYDSFLMQKQSSLSEPFSHFISVVPPFLLQSLFDLLLTFVSCLKGGQVRMKKSGRSYSEVSRGSSLEWNGSLPTTMPCVDSRVLGRG